MFHLQERSKILLRFADLIDEHNDELATLETLDNGKPYEQARAIEVPMMSRLFRYYAGIISFGISLFFFSHFRSMVWWGLKISLLSICIIIYFICYYNLY